MSTKERSCRERRESLGLLACGLLPDDVAEALRRHLAECSGCRAYAEELANVTAALQTWQRQTQALPLPPSRARDWVEAIQTDSTPHPQSLSIWLRRLQVALTLVLRYPRLPQWGLAAVWGIILLLHASAPAVHLTTATPSPAAATIELRMVWQALRQPREKTVEPIQLNGIPVAPGPQGQQRRTEPHANRPTTSGLAFQICGSTSRYDG